MKEDVPTITLHIETKRFKRRKKWNGEPAPACWRWYHNIFPKLYKPWTYEVSDTIYVQAVSDEDINSLIINEVERTRNDY